MDSSERSNRQLIGSYVSQNASQIGGLFALVTIGFGADRVIRWMFQSTTDTASSHQRPHPPAGPPLPPKKHESAAVTSASVTTGSDREKKTLHDNEIRREPRLYEAFQSMDMFIAYSPYHYAEALKYANDMMRLVNVFMQAKDPCIFLSKDGSDARHASKLMQQCLYHLGQLQEAAGENRLVYHEIEAINENIQYILNERYTDIRLLCDNVSSEYEDDLFRASLGLESTTVISR